MSLTTLGSVFVFLIPTNEDIEKRMRIHEKHYNEKSDEEEEKELNKLLEKKREMV